MKQIFTLLFAVLAFAACTQNDVEELTANRADVPEILTIGFEGDDTRIQLEAGKTVWTSGDLVSVFYKSDANQQWEYRGETGARVADLYCVDKGVESSRMNYVVVAYPYNPDYIISTASGNIETTLPATQHYAEDSYGVGENLMVSQSEFTQFSLKSVCGWLKIQLTGNGEKVTRLTLRGNNEEQLAGLIYVDTATAESTLASEMGSADDNNAGGNLVFDDAIVTELTLDCGEGVALGKNATAFYIAVPPQTFEKGFTVEVECDNGTSTTKSTSEPITIERNHIKPMETIEYDGVLPEVYELAYRTNDGKALDPYTTEGFGGEFEENIFDVATGEGKLVFAGAVTAIPDNAFGLCENLTWIDLPLGITSIGASAFSGCTAMEEITIPASVASVGSAAFVNCTAKAYINCNANNSFFKNAGFTEVVIGDSVMTIGDGAFDDCYSLTSVTIGDSVTTIGYRAFYECHSLTSVTIGDSVTTIGNYAFYECRSLTSITIPDSATTIGGWAFSDCNSLTSITIPDSVTTIGNGAFAYCSSLTSITIPDSVTTIGDDAFSTGNSLTSVYCEATTPPSLDGSNVFDYNADDRKIYVPEESVRQYKIAEGWSEYADAIVGFDFSITSIINYTTSDGQIVNARLPIISNTYNNGVGTIEFLNSIISDRAFYDCDNLTSVTIGNSVTTIEDYAFAYCDSLTSITIPDSVTTIGERAFYRCYNYISICCEAITPPSLDGSNVFNEYFYGYIYVPMESVEAYKSAVGWSEHADYIVGCDFSTAPIINYTTSDGKTITSRDLAIISNKYENGVGTMVIANRDIPHRAFYNCDSLTSITIPDSVTTIGDYAFSGCTSLTSITIPDSVTTFGEWAFYGCDSLTSITIGDSVTTIGGSAFQNCSSLTSITIPDSVTTIGNWVFYGCDSLTSVTIGDSVTTIRDYAFCECNSLTSVTIGDSVTTIGFCAFANCNSLTCITIPDSVTTIEDYAFCGCDNLTSVTIGNDVTTIGVGVFCECYTLTSVTIPDSVTTIGERAFAYCNSLTSVTIPDSVTTIGVRAFAYCDSLTSVTIPDSVTTIGDYAFYSCDSLTEFRGKYASEDGRCLIIDGVLTSFAPAGLTEYTVSDSITAVGAAAFAGCNNLTKFRGKYASEDGRCLIIDGTLNAFAPAGITEYTIPNNVTKIGSHAFDGCSLTSITIPDSVTAIGDYAFEGCNSLTSVYCNATTPPSLEGSSVFNSYGSDCWIYVPLESLNIYRLATGWSRYSAIIASIHHETGEIVKPIPFIGICGSFTNWGGSEDIGMEYLEERNLYVAYGIELNEDDEFKLRKYHNWDHNYGLEYDGEIYTNTYTTLAENNYNIRVYQTGVYDIYFNADTLMFYLMEQGVDPNDAQYR